jgi:hypothetical protein
VVTPANDNDNEKSAETAEQTGKPCPICARPGLRAYRPFCSRRCADVDLGRWLSGTYAVPAAPDPDDEDEFPHETRDRE